MAADGASADVLVASAALDDAGQAAGAAPPPVDTGRAAQQLVVLAVLIAFYALIPVVAAADFVFQLLVFRNGTDINPKIDPDLLIQFLGPLSTKQGSVLEALHKLILPLAALFVGSNFSIIKSRPIVSWLFIIPLVGTVCSLLSASLLDAFPSNEMTQHYPVVTTLFRDVASNLGVFLMLMIGQSLERPAK